MEIEIPKHIKDPPNDYISFRTKDKHGEVTNYDNYNCFNHIMKSLPVYEIEIFPISYTNEIDKENYQEWMNLCKMYNILHKDCQLLEEKGLPKMVIPRGMADKYATYCSMCCYRWGITNQKLTYTVVQLIEKLKNVSFWQILHFAFCKHISNYNHSFSVLNNSNVYYDYYNGNNKSGNVLSLSHSIVLKQYFDNPSQFKFDTESHLNKNLGRSATQLGSLNVPRIEILLDPKWVTLYNIIEPTAEKLQNLYNEIKAE